MFKCPSCQSSDTSRQFQINDIWISDCNTCGHRFAEFTPTLEQVEGIFGDDYFEGGGAGYPGYLLERDLLIQRGRRYGELINKYTQPGLMLDVGAAAGFLLKGYTEAGWRGVGVEPNARMAAYAKQHLGLDVFPQPLEEFHYPEQFDLISAIQVVMSLFDITKAMEILAEHTKPGGYWLIEAWNKDSLTAKLTGKLWHEYCPPSVIHWFSPNSLSEFVGRYGMELVAQGRPPKKISGAHAKSLISYKLDGNPLAGIGNTLLKVVPDEMILTYPAEDLFWAIFRKKQ